MVFWCSVVRSSPLAQSLYVRPYPVKTAASCPCSGPPTGPCPPSRRARCPPASPCAPRRIFENNPWVNCFSCRLSSLCALVHCCKATFSLVINCYVNCAAKPEINIICLICLSLQNTCEFCVRHFYCAGCHQWAGSQPGSLFFTDLHDLMFSVQGVILMHTVLILSLSFSSIQIAHLYL